MNREQAERIAAAILSWTSPVGEPAPEWIVEQRRQIIDALLAAFPDEAPAAAPAPASPPEWAMKAVRDIGERPRGFAYEDMARLLAKTRDDALREAARASLMSGGDVITALIGIAPRGA